jgi:hypothetical protein
MTQTSGDNSFYFYNNGSTSILTLSQTSVGIGTNPSNSKLHIYADHVSGHSVLKIQTITAIASGGVPSLALFDSDGSRNTLVYAASDGTYLANEVAKPIIFSTNSTEKVRINSDGNVGIGTTAPAAKLDVVGGNVIIRNDASGGSATLYLRNWAGSPTTTMVFGNSTGDDSSTSLSLNSNIFSITNYGDPGSYIRFGTRNNSTSDIRMCINPDGNVGIGTTNASNKLEVRGGIQLLNSSGSTSAATSASLMILGQNTLGGSSYHDFLYVRNTLSTTITPQKTFRLNNSGSIEIVNNAYTSIIFSLTDAGVLSTTGGGTSDIRTKQNIEYIYEDVSTTINKLKPAKFEFKNNPNVARHGFIAQDVLPIKPELVLGDGDKEAGTYGLDYDGILALTVKALQEANIKTKQLENKIETLEARLSVLENK